MKILSNFDTRMDSKIFLKKIKQYWNHNVLLIKRHPLFLYKAFLTGILAIVIFILLLYLLYFKYSDDTIFYYVFLILNLLWIWLWLIILIKKIVLKLFTYVEFISCKEELEKIDLSQFGSFLKYSFALFFYQLTISISNIIILFILENEKSVNLLWAIGIFILNIIFLFLIVRIIKRFIDFEMDFIIVTKDEIEWFNQEWIFKRKVISLDITKIRSITTEKNGFLKSLFNIGSLKILSEWDTEHKWEIRFNYIHKLWTLKTAVLWLIKQNENRTGIFKDN